MDSPPAALGPPPAAVVVTLSPRSARPWWLIGGAVLALAALVLALVALQQRRARQAEENQTNELRDVSGRTIAALSSYDYQHLDQWKTSVLANATGSFQNQFESSFAGFAQAYIAEHNRGTGAIQGVWIGPVVSGKATAVVLVHITVTSLTGTHSLEPYIQVTLLEVAGRWRVDDVQATVDTGGSGGGSSASGANPPVTTTVPAGG
ncbi:MAG: hypothetical protein M3083_05175 [Actinomycetota bacterium]|nr:hypothetical protein [Actinomycetota bacterium]